MATATVSGLTTIEDMEPTPTITSIGGGSPAAVNTDIFREGTQSLGRKASNTARRGFGVDITSTNLTTAGRQVWVWWIIPQGAANLLTRANGGVRIRFSSTAGGATNYEEFNVGGSDTVASGEWVRTVLDPTNLTAAGTNGTVNYAAVLNISITYAWSSVPGGNLDHVVMDIIHYGSTIEVTGGTTGDRLTWDDISTATEGGPTGNQWGVLYKPPGISAYVANGTIQLGDLAGAVNCYLADSNQIIEWQDQVYHDGTSTVGASIPTTFQGVDIVEDTGITEVADGDKIGTGDTATGANGSIFQLPPGALGAGHLDASDADVTDVSLYGTKIARFTDQIAFCADATNGPNHEVLGVVFDDCAQVGAGRVVIRNSVFQGYNGTDTALLWNANIDIKNSAFRNNTDATNDPAAIEHSVAGTFGYDNLRFSANDYDIENSVAATTADSYSDTNQDSTQAVGNGTTTGVGQSFTNSTSGKITNVRFDLSKTGSPTGNLVARLYALASAIGGGDDVPTGAALAESDPVSAAGLTGTLTLTEFNFSDNITMSATTDYFIAVEEDTGYSGDGSNYVNVGTDTSTPAHAGNMATEAGTWTAVSGTDVCFFVSRGALLIIQASNDADPGTFKNTGSPPGGVRIENGVTLTVTAKFGTNAVSGARVRIETSPGGVLITEGTTNASGVFSDTYNYVGAQAVKVIVRLKGFKFFSATDSIGAGGLSVAASMVPDPTVNLP